MDVASGAATADDDEWTDGVLLLSVAAWTQVNAVCRRNQRDIADISAISLFVMRIAPLIFPPLNSAFPSGSTSAVH